MVKRLSKRKKTRASFSRKSQSSVETAPMKNFWVFADFFRTEVDKKELSKVIKKYMKASYDKKTVAFMNKCPEWKFTCNSGVAATIAWQQADQILPERWHGDDYITKFFDDLHKYGKTVQSELPKTLRRSIQDILKEKTSDFIAGVEHVIDKFYDTYEPSSYSVYDEMVKADVAYNTAKAVHDYYLPLREELYKLLHKAPADLKEGYADMTQPEKQSYFELVDGIITDSIRYMNSKKVKRKTRKPKTKSAIAQIKKLQYLKESKEFKLVSIEPVNIIGCHRLYTFNTINRTITEFIACNVKGFGVKGTTLQGVNIESSRQTRLRKPDEFLPVVQNGTPFKVNKAWKKLTTKTTLPNCRINKHTIIIRALDK